MSKIKKGIIGALVTLFLAAMATVGTGAYFSDTNNGQIDGTVGSIKVTTSGGSGAENADFAFANLLPGDPQSATVGYQNTGRNAQDVWVVFPNSDALHALNQLGTYGEVHLKSGATSLFDSANLNDDQAPATGSCGGFDPSGCWPLASKYKLASNVAPNATGSMTFTFAYASKLVGGNVDGAAPAWNQYPVPGSTNPGPAGSGLPYQIVATQVGQTP
jgi:hypothetical protein